MKAIWKNLELQHELVSSLQKKKSHCSIQSGSMAEIEEQKQGNVK